MVRKIGRKERRDDRHVTEGGIRLFTPMREILQIVGENSRHRRNQKQLTALKERIVAEARTRKVTA